MNAGTIGQKRTGGYSGMAEAGMGVRCSRLNSGVFSSASDEWETPQEFFDLLDDVYHFTLDVCATSENAKCERYFSRAEDGLSQSWEGVCWMNPPYGNEITHWVRKAHKSSLQKNTLVVCLLPARTDTKWWHEYVMAHAESIGFIRGRLKFSGKDPAPFPSALAVFGRGIGTVINSLGNSSPKVKLL